MDGGLLDRVKDQVGDPARGPALHDSLLGEAARVIDGMKNDRFAADRSFSPEELVGRSSAYEELSEALARAASLVMYWSDVADERIVSRIVSRLANAVERTLSTGPWLDLSLYPALLVMYAGGLGAVIGWRESQLAGLLTAATVREQRGRVPAVLALHAYAAMDHDVAKRLPGLEKRSTPMSDHLAETLRPWLEDLEPDPEAFEHAFDRWEYLLGLVMFDLTRDTRGDGWAPVGRLSWRGEYGNGIDQQISAEISTAGPRWPLLQAGLFAGDSERLADSVKAWNEHIAQVRRQHF